MVYLRIYMGHVIDKMANIYRVYRFVAGEFLLLFNSVIDT